MGVDAVSNRCCVAGRKIFGDLETSTRFALSALSGKAEAISKSISKTHIFLETTLEIGGACRQRLPGRLDAPSGTLRAKSCPARRPPGELARHAEPDVCASRRRG